MKDEVFLSVIIPAYNEEKRIQKTLCDLFSYFSKHKDKKYEILVVDDGSSDRTEDAIKKYKDQLDIKIIKNNKNYGKGFSVRKGMFESRGKYKLFMDADGSVSIFQIGSFFSALDDGYDIAIASIEKEGSKILEKSSWHKKVLGKLSKFIIKKTVLPNISDSQRGFKLFSEKSAHDIFKRQTLDGWGFDIEILVIANDLGYKIKEIPVVWDNPSGSKVKFFDYIKTLKDLFVIKKNKIFQKYKM